MSMRIGAIADTGHLGTVFAGCDELEDVQFCAIAPGCPDEKLEEARWHIEDRAIKDVAVYDDYHKMLDAEDLDIVVVAPLLHLHAEITCEVLWRGKPVFVEKPLALTHESLEAVRTAQAESGQPIGMMMSFRYVPSFYTAQKLVAAGRIGEPTVGYAQKSYKWGKREDYYKKRETFGGIIPWVGIHAIDWFQWISGREYASVSAQHSKLHRPDYPGTEDAATCLFELDNGGTAVMSFDYMRPTGAETHGDDRLRLIGDKGVIEVAGHKEVTLITESGTEQVPAQEPDHGLFADFVMSVKNADHSCAISTEECIRLTSTALHARDAADNGERIQLRG